MVKILGTGTTTDGQEYVMVNKEDFKELQTAKLLVDFARKHGRDKCVLAKLTGGSRQANRNRKGTPTRIPKELREAFDKSFNKALAKLGHPKGATVENENSFYKLRDWTKVKI
jgi:hypothetical protein